MKKTTLDFLNTNAGRAVCAIALLLTLWLLRADLYSQATAKWISDGHGAFGQVFDLGLMFGALFGIGFWLCLPVLTTPEELKHCAFDRDECTVTLAFENEADVDRFLTSHAARSRVKVFQDECDYAALRLDDEEVARIRVR